MKKVKYVLLGIMLAVGALFINKYWGEFFNEKTIALDTQDIICCESIYSGSTEIISNKYSHKKYCGGEHNTEKYTSTIVGNSMCKKKYQGVCKNIRESDASVCRYGRVHY